MSLNNPYQLASYRKLGLWRDTDPGNLLYAIIDSDTRITYYEQECLSPEAALRWFTEVCVHGLAGESGSRFLMGYTHPDGIPKEVLQAASEVSRLLTFLLRLHDPEEVDLGEQDTARLERLAHELLSFRLKVPLLAEPALMVDFVLDAD